MGNKLWSDRIVYKTLYGLVARVPNFHSEGLGSVTRIKNIFFFIYIFFSFILYATCE